MIQINLLPQEAQNPKAAAAAAREPGQAGGLVVMLLVLLLALGIPGVGAAFVIVRTAASNAELEEVRRQRTNLTNEVRRLEAEYSEISEGLEIARRQWRVIQSLNAEDRLFWTEKLNLLPLLVPDGIFLTRLRVSETVRDSETRESRERREAWERLPARQRPPQPPREMMTTITQTLTIDGISYVADGTSDERLDRIIGFIRALEGQRVRMPFSGEMVSFMDGFRQNVEWTRFTDRNMGGRIVQDFSLTITGIPFGGSAD